jgi:hypothetical protein
MSEITVTIQGGVISIPSNQHKVQVSISGKQVVTWICGQQTFTIAPKSGTSFVSVTADQTGNIWKAQLGPFTAQGSLFYKISAPVATTLDPEIEVVP